MAIIKVIDPTTFEPQQYSTGDENSIPTFPVKSTFGLEGGRVETLVYDLNNNILNYNPDSLYSVVENGGSGEPSLADALELYPQKEIEQLGYSIGSYNIVYIVTNNEVSSSNSQRFRIKEISANRQELRLTSGFLNKDELKQAVENFLSSYKKSSTYLDFYLNFGNGNLFIANNILFDSTNDQYSILVKLYKPLPSFIQVGENLNPWICTLQRETVAYNITFEQEVISIKDTIDLKGPNFSLDLNNQVHTSIKPTNFEDLNNITNLESSSYEELQYILNQKGIEVNIDYTNLNNFVHFSSAEMRVRNFYDKMVLLEDYKAELSNSHSIDNSVVSASAFVIQEQIDSIIKNFDGFEYWMYYNSSSNSSPPNGFPTPWPKKGNVGPPYGKANYPPITNNNIVDPWYENALFSASIYDEQNKDNLNKAIPDYLLEDEANEPYFRFVGMIGQHFDTLFTYIQDISNRYNADNRLDFGISKDLVGEAIKSMGINLYTGNFNSTDLYAAFIGVGENDSNILPLEDGQSLSQITNYVTASSMPIPTEDINREIYKRIYHNLPLLLRQKGSMAGVRTLITCFGLPHNITNIEEFDISYIGVTQSLPPIDQDGDIVWDTKNISLPPFRSGYIPPEFLSPSVRVQQHYVKSESYDRSLQYAEVGYSPQGYIDKTDHLTFEPFASNFPNFAEFYYGDNPNYYTTRFINDSVAPTITQTVTWDFSAYIRYIKFLDSSLFSMVKDFIPSRTSTATGVIIKPTIKERNRQRPAQILSNNNNNYSGSVDTLYYDWSEQKYIRKAIGDYDAKIKTGSFEWAGSTAGGWNGSNQAQFISGASSLLPWELSRDLATPVEGLVQYWSESIYTQMGYAQQYLQTGSKIIEDGNHKLIHNTQDEFYNGIFKQTGIGSFDNYLIREMPTGSSSDGAGIIRTDNNRFNPYKKASDVTFAMVKENVEEYDEFIPALDAGFDMIYIVINGVAPNSLQLLLRSGDGTTLPLKEVLLSNGSFINLTSGNNNISIAVGQATEVPFYPDYVAFDILGGADAFGGVLQAYVFKQDNTWDYIAPFDPTDLDTLPGPWAYNDYNPLINNSSDPQAGFVNYNGIRKSSYIMDVDYSPSSTEPSIPINWVQLGNGSASRAPVQDSYYNSRWWLNSRYWGVRNSSPDFNIEILKSSTNINTIISDGIGENVSSTTPSSPNNPSSPNPSDDPSGD